MEFKLKSEFIELDNLLKVLNFVSNGHEAKILILARRVRVNDIVETRLRRKLRCGDRICVDDTCVAIV